jgi:uncharacterized protein
MRLFATHICWMTIPIGIGIGSGLFACSTSSRQAPRPTPLVAGQSLARPIAQPVALSATRADPNSATPPTGAACVGPGAQTEQPNGRNILGAALSACPSKYRTGFHRNGYCNTGPDDRGVHVVCARVSDAFLTFSRNHGNDLSHASEGFPGLEPGDTWCLCAARYREALEAGVAPEVYVEATDITALGFIDQAALVAHARRLPAAATPAGRSE